MQHILAKYKVTIFFIINGQFQQALQDTYHHVRQNIQARHTCNNPTSG